MLTRDAILSFNDLPRKEVEVPEWGGSVYIRVMSGAEREEMLSLFQGEKLTAAALVVLCVVDVHGTRLFTAEDVEAVNGKRGDVLLRIANEAMRYNGLTAEGVDDAKNS
jgi:hypothetical protein